MFKTEILGRSLRAKRRHKMWPEALKRESADGCSPSGRSSGTFFCMVCYKSSSASGIIECSTSAGRKANVARARELLAIAPTPETVATAKPKDARPPCPCLGGPMVTIEIFERRMHRMQPRRLPSGPF